VTQPTIVIFGGPQSATTLERKAIVKILADLLVGVRAVYLAEETVVLPELKRVAAKLGVPVLTRGTSALESKLYGAGARNARNARMLNEAVIAAGRCSCVVHVVAIQGGRPSKTTNNLAREARRRPPIKISVRQLVDTHVDRQEELF